MSSRLDLRVAKLERAPGANGVDLRVFGTVAEADADTRPAGSGRCSRGGGGRELRRRTR